MLRIIFIFFFQAEDGIRDLYVTGVQTCALPIFQCWGRWSTGAASAATVDGSQSLTLQNASLHWIAGPTFEAAPALPTSRSEERRVGKECRYRRSPLLENKYDIQLT